MNSLVTLQITKPHPVIITMKYTGKIANFFGQDEKEFLVVIPSQKNHPEYMECKFYTNQFPLLGNGEFKVQMTDGFMTMHGHDHTRIPGFEWIEDVLIQWFGN